ncbi:hypothetical protein NFI96_008966, partial [Prochilodus magdalenae]
MNKIPNSCFTPLALISVRTFPNQKPWINTEVRVKLRARTTAYNTGDLENYKKARYDLQRTIRVAKRNYRDRVESNYHGSDLRRMWNGLRAITDYKDNSSAFNTIIPAKLIPKLTDLGLNSHLCNWILDFLTGRPQVTHIITIFKFADDTTILGLITDGDETAYRDEVSALSEWCYHNNLSLNISKTKEMIVNYRKLQRGGHSPMYINGAEVERVSSVRFLVIHLTYDLNWSLHTNKVERSARRRIFFLRRLRKFGLPPDILTNFYRCTKESILTACITVWYGSCTAYDCRALKSVVRTAESIIGSKLPDLKDIYLSCCLRKIQKIRLDCSHPAHGLFTLLPPDRSKLPDLKDIYLSCCLRKIQKIRLDCSHPAHGLFTLLPPDRSKLPDLKDIYLSCCLRKIQKIRLDCSHPAHGLFTLLPPDR